MGANLKTLIFISIALIHSPLLAQNTFQGLGFLHSNAALSNGFGVSADGSTVVGNSFADPASYFLTLEGYKWTSSTGMMSLGAPTGFGYSTIPLKTSQDGSAIAGYFLNAGLPAAFKWTQSGGFTPIAPLLGQPNSYAIGISWNGSVISGWSGTEAIRWTESTGTVGLGYLGAFPPALGGGFQSGSYGISGDGKTIVGNSSSSLGGQAFRYTDADGMVGLGELDGGGYSSVAFDASYDGSVIVGYGSRELGSEPMRWTEATGMVGLGYLDGYYNGVAYATSADGSVVVGHNSFWDFNSVENRVAIVWDSANGIRNLKALLQSDYGLDLTGWTLVEATDISADAKTVVGWGYNPNNQQEAWIVKLSQPIPEPSAILYIAALIPILVLLLNYRKM